MKNIIAILLITASVSVYADELSTVVAPAAQPASKLERIQQNIDKYTALINSLPKKLQDKILNFERLQGLGQKAEKVLRLYVAATSSCSGELHSSLGEEACSDMASLDLGIEIKREKEHVLAMISEAKRELEQVKAEEKDVPLIMKLIESLKSTKAMMMREG